MSAAARRGAARAHLLDDALDYDFSDHLLLDRDIKRHLQRGSKAHLTTDVDC